MCSFDLAVGLFSLSFKSSQFQETRLGCAILLSDVCKLLQAQTLRNHPVSCLSLCFLVYIPTHLNRNLFLWTCNPPLSVHRADIQPQTAIRSYMRPPRSPASQDASCFVMRRMPARYSAHSHSYRWEWHIHPLWRLLRGRWRLTGPTGAAVMDAPGALWWSMLAGLARGRFSAVRIVEGIIHHPCLACPRLVREREKWGARPLAACLPAPSSAEMPTRGWSRTTRSRILAGRRRHATCSTSATGRTSMVNNTTARVCVCVCVYM